jgi:hypothetical protein
MPRPARRPQRACAVASMHAPTRISKRQEGHRRAATTKPPLAPPSAEVVPKRASKRDRSKNHLSQQPATKRSRKRARAPSPLPSSEEDESSVEEDTDEDDGDDDDDSSASTMDNKETKQMMMIQQLAKMDPQVLVRSYQRLRTNSGGILPPLEPRDTLPSLRNNLTQYLADLDALEGEDDANDDIVKEEHRAYIRSIRSYTNKADQERIEKLEEKERHHHHEQRRDREYSMYGSGKQRKAAAAPVIELDQFQERSIQFVGNSEFRNASKQKCPHPSGDCLICGKLKKQAVAVATAKPDILFPSFVFVGEDDYDNRKKTDDGNASKEEENGGSSRRKSKRDVGVRTKVSSLELHQMLHDLDFVETYNQGLIKQPTKRAR